MILPTQIRWFSLPSLVFSTLFLWNGIVYLIFVKILRRDSQTRQRYLFFALSSVALSLYSFATFSQYNSVEIQGAIFWQQLEFVALDCFFIFFVFFSFRLFNISFRPWKIALVLSTALFLPAIFIPNWFLTEVPAPKKLHVGSFVTTFYENELGPGADAFLLLCLITLTGFFIYWFCHREKPLANKIVPISFALFFVTALNDIFVVEGVYHFFYLLEFGFLGFIVAMAYTLFHDYIEANHQLALQSEQIEKFNEEMKFLLSSISHDLSAPLVSIKGFVDLMHDEIPATAEERSHYLQRIKRNSENMLTMIESIVHFLRIGRVEWKPEPIDLESIIQEVLMVLCREREDPEVKIELPQTYPPLFSAVGSVRQILLNLIQNALKYAPKNRREVRVECREEGAGVELAVSNPGPMIPPEFAEQIFSPFVRRETRVPGAGLGLAIVKKSAEDLGGKVWLDGQFKDGARFCVWLPNVKG